MSCGPVRTKEHVKLGKTKTRTSTLDDDVLDAQGHTLVGEHDDPIVVQLEGVGGQIDGGSLHQEADAGDAVGAL